MLILIDFDQISSFQKKCIKNVFMTGDRRNPANQSKINCFLEIESALIYQSRNETACNLSQQK